jgi:hypothetical protein
MPAALANDFRSFPPYAQGLAVSSAALGTSPAGNLTHFGWSTFTGRITFSCCASFFLKPPPLTFSLHPPSSPSCRLFFSRTLRYPTIIHSLSLSFNMRSIHNSSSRQYASLFSLVYQAMEGDTVILHDNQPARTRKVNFKINLPRRSLESSRRRGKDGTESLVCWPS